MEWLKSTRGQAAVLVTGFILAAGALSWLAISGNNAFLTRRPPAEWIIYPTPADAQGFYSVEFSTEFRRAFELESVPASARLSVRCLRQGAVLVNGQVFPQITVPGQGWKQPTEYEVARLLRPGTNEISVTVTNRLGLPALWLSLCADKYLLASDESWQASMVGAVWQNARLASRPLPIVAGNALYGGEGVVASLRARWLWFLALAAAIAVLLAGMTALQRRSSSTRAEGKARLSQRAIGTNPAWLVWGVLVVGWVVLWLNNLGYLPPTEGFDVSDHLAYVDYILKQHRLPLANEGFQMYQPPLYYLLAALQLAIFRASPYQANGIFVLRLFGLACGIATFTLVLLSLRLLFPEKPRAQIVGLVLAGLLPPNLYLCQHVTNELLVMLLMAAAVYACLRLLANPLISPAQHALVGVLCGAALLAKSSALVLLPVSLAALWWNLQGKAVPSGRRAIALGLFLFGCLAVCGWHYSRVALRFGNPFIGNWDIGTGFNWWQQPGFRTGTGYLSTGRCLTQPFCSAFASFGDGIYSTLWGDGLYSGEADLFHRPPWNYDLMAAGYLFALLPSLAFLAGVCRLAVKCAREPGWFLVLSLISLFGALLVYYSLKVPSYAACKAFYASGALVPFCALAAAGWDWLARARALRFFVFVGLGVWAVNTYASFWIRHKAEHTQFLKASGSADAGRHDQAVLSLMHLLSERPRDVQAAQLLSRELCRLGRVAEGRQIAELALQWADNDADCHLARGAALAHQKLWDQAVAEARRAIELAPDHPWASEHLADWLLRAGHTGEAIVADRNALRINPTRTQLHFYLALGLASQGQTAGALEAYRRALQLDPKFAPALNGLALLLSTCAEPKWRNGAEAVRLATRACEAERNPRHLQTLAIALAETGRLDDAAATAQKAADSARAAGDQSEAFAAEQLLKRLKPDRTYDLPNQK